jgi:hypothetical protein
MVRLHGPEATLIDIAVANFKQTQKKKRVAIEKPERRKVVVNRDTEVMCDYPPSSFGNRSLCIYAHDLIQLVSQPAWK